MNDSSTLTSSSLDRHQSLVVLVKLLALAALLYLFIIAVTLLGASFKLMGKGVAESLFLLTANPLAGLSIGVLATAVIQSSSTTTSIIIGLVGSGGLSFASAVPMIMGANIGTSVTNTIVSMAQTGHGSNFRRAFAGSTMHDFFNLCSVLVLLPLEIFFGAISRPAMWVVHQLIGFEGVAFKSPVAAISKPVAKAITHLLGDIGWLSAVVALILLFISLRYLTKVLKSLILNRVERFFQRFVFRNAVTGFALGLILTVLVQSSSITTSLAIPLLGAGLVTLNQVFPYTLGANIGTTVTAFLASFAIGTPVAIGVAFAHLLFNVFGTAIFWPLKRVPISMAEKLSDMTQDSRIIPLVYIMVVFFILPGIMVYTMR